MWGVLEGKMYTECRENLKERDYLELPIVRARIILKWRSIEK
jgi:hypothetical protein